MRRVRQPSEGPLRADAKRNRERLLVAAEAVFLERGADASLDDVAKRAKVGIGTLYRHFPTRDALLGAACDARLLALAERSRGRDADRLPGDSLRRFLEDLVRYATVYRGLAASLGVVLNNGTPGCHATSEEGRRLLLRAQRARAVRRDVSFDDLVCIATAASLAALGTPTRRRVAHLVALFVDGLGARGKS